MSTRCLPVLPATMSLLVYKKPTVRLVHCANKGDQQGEPADEHKKELIKKKLEACFEKTPLPREKSQRQKWNFKCAFNCGFNKAFEGDQKPKEHVLGTTIHNVPVKGCEKVLASVRDELRALVNLLPYVKPEKPRPQGSRGGMTQTEVTKFMETERAKHLSNLQCKAFYSCKFSFASADNIHLRSFLDDLKKGDADHWTPLNSKGSLSPTVSTRL